LGDERVISTAMTITMAMFNDIGIAIVIEHCY
jgi:hypothetical protein